jgi:rod shape-determining protein MreC
VRRSSFTVRGLASRFLYAGLIGAAVGLMLIGKIESVLVEEIRTRLLDVSMPLLEMLAAPVTRLAGLFDNVGELAALREENERLRTDNARLLQLQVIAQRLEGENQALRGLLNLVPSPTATFVTARVVADTGGAFARTIVINVGASGGVAPRQIVTSGEGLVGRVQQVGDRSARVLLLTDLNSKVPVVVGGERRRAILSGENSDMPRLTHVDGGGDVKRGDLVLTSGHGGVFPPGLPVGLVAGETGLEVQAFVDWNRLEFVRVIDYSAVLPAGPSSTHPSSPHPTIAHPSAPAPAPGTASQASGPPAVAPTGSRPSTGAGRPPGSPVPGAAPTAQQPGRPQRVPLTVPSAAAPGSAPAPSSTARR